MKSKKINNSADRPRVLVAPLDWGLGHATRCIPVIFKLLQLNCDVIIAAEAAGKILLQKEFPDLAFVELKGYRMQYSRNRYLLPLKLLLQFPKLLFRIYAEKKWLKKIVEDYQIDFVISDNRLGLYNKDIPCVYITHQLKISTGNRFTEMLAQKIHYHFINKYNACWVPDGKGEKNLAGDLSHPKNLPEIPVKYLGPISRFEKNKVQVKYDLCILLSGPEPQRTFFEKIILNDLKNYSGKAFLVRGLPGNASTISVGSPTLHVQNHLPAAELNLLLQQSTIIISRSGYTTVMDLVKLQKKAILVPTPGQTEQEYLADYLYQQKLFYCTSQKKFVLNAVLKKAADFNYAETSFPETDYTEILEDFIKVF